ncbi:MAG: DUF4189 domain-containing protein [Pirellulales bacterium]|nr:DUF4189 domain-containing protein [Pirellulales bacterium]
MKRFAVCCALALGSLCASISAASATDWIDIDDDSYAAIAYSPATGHYAYAYNYGSRWSAEKAALRQLDEEDGRIVCWVNNGFCALALGDDVGCWGTGYEWGDGASNLDAANRARSECSERTSGAHVVLVLSSDGQVIQKPSRTTYVTSYGD